MVPPVVAELRILLPIRPTRPWVLPAIVLLTGSIFVADLLTARGIAIWVLYLLPLTLTNWLASSRAPLAYAGLAVVLDVTGFLLSPAGLWGWPALANRLIALGVFSCGGALNFRLRRARDAESEAQERLKLLIQYAPAALAMFDRDRRYLAVSQRWITDYRLEGQAVLGRRHDEVVPDLPDRWREIHRRAQAGETIAMAEDPFLRANGSVRWLRWEVRPWRAADGEVGGIVIFTEEITALKEAHQAVEASEERLRLALDAAELGIFDWDIATGRITWSEWHGRLWGYSPGEYDGSFEMFTRRVHPDDLPAVDAALARTQATRTPYRMEFRVVRPDGTSHWVQGQGQFTFGPDGQPKRMRGVVKDVTDRKVQEEALRESNAVLATLTARLNHALEEERARISREIHDELGQLLTGVKMDLRWVERHLDTLFAADRRVNPVLDKLVAASELVDATIVSVQRFAAELRPGILDALGLGPALQFEAARFQLRTGVEVIVHLPVDEPPISPEASTVLFRIGQEALTNVARHANARHVTIEFRASAGSAELVVADDGQGAPSGQTEAAGSLGLLGMRERARAVGGTVVFQTAPGLGMTVTARIPLAPEARAP